MKKIMLVFILFSLINCLQAQSDVTPIEENIKKEVGVNFTNFFLRFLSSKDAQQSDPSVLLYVKRGKNNEKWRHGIGARLFRFNEDNKDFTTFIQLDYAFGKEYHRTISERWSVYFAWECILSGSYSEEKRVFNNGDDNKSWIRRANTGFQTLGGIQFYLNNRLSLLTETSYGLLFQYSRDDDADENYTFKTVYTPPISLILTYHF